MSVEQNLSFAGFNRELLTGPEDTADQSARHQQVENEAVLRNHRLKTKPEPQAIDADGVVWCKGDCGLPVPKERLAMQPAAAYCVECLEFIEKRDKAWRLD